MHRPESIVLLLALLSVGELSDVQIAPSGQRVLYTLTTRDVQRNMVLRSHWVVGANGGKADSLRVSGAAYGLRWLRDGRGVSYVVPNGRGSELRRGAKVVFTHPQPIASYDWSRDGREIVFLARREREAEKAGTGALVDISRFRYSDILYGRLGRGDQRGELYSYEVGKRRARKLTGDRDVTAFALSPDGQMVAFSARRATFAESAVDLLLYRASTDSVELLETGDGDGSNWDNTTYFESPFWSPDGALVGYLRRDMRERWAASPRVGVYSLRERRTTFLQADSVQLSTDVRAFWLTPERVLLESTWRAGRRLFSLELRDGAIRSLMSDDGWSAQFSFAHEGRVAFTRERIDSVPALYLSDTLFATTRRVAGVTPVEAPRVQRVQWRSTDGVEVEGWVYLPEGRGPFPTLTFVHGGPTIVAGNRFAPYSFAPYNLLWPHAFAAYAARGIAVFLPNYRGTASYGKAFLAPRRLDDEPVEDIRTGIDALIASGIADSTRLAIAGHSHGCWLASLVATRSPRFVAGAFAEGWGDAASLYGQTRGWAGRNILEYYFGSTPWDNPHRYGELSPVYHFDALRAKRMPMLLEFGDKSWWPQGLEFANAAARADLPSEFVIYRNTDHNITEPRVMLESAERNLEFFSRWLLGDR